MYIDLTNLNEGTSQDERRIKALMPDFIDIDERNIADFLKFITNISSQFTYYNISNKPEGAWDDFFKSDMNILLVLIAKFDMQAQIRLFAQHEDELYLAGNEKDLFAALKNMFDFVLHVFNILYELRERLLNVSNRGKMSEELFKIVDSFDDEALKLNRYTAEARRVFGKMMEVDTPDYFINVNSDDHDKDPLFKGTSPKERIINALPAIKNVFNDLSTKCNHLMGVTRFYLKNNNLLTQEYPPFLALFISFLHLYKHLQDKLNGTTRAHLDLYYKQILGLDLKKALPDSVHIVFEKDAIAPYVLLKKGDALLAQIPGQQAPATFTLNEDLLVTGAQIAELRTVYLAERIQLKNHAGTVKEVQVYNGTYPSNPASVVQKIQTPITTWPVLGEDQEGLPETAKSMTASDIGIMMASPVLYQTEGRRMISFHLYLEDESYMRLMAYFTNYANVSQKEVMAVSHQLLSDAFVIHYTDTVGWVEIEKYSAVLSEDERRLEIELHVNQADQVIDIYRPEIHGGTFDISWPVFRFLLKNYSVNNPFTYLQDVKINRVSITADVKGSRAVKLQNNVGPLSATSPSQIFGPQPSVGSYLDIKNSNIFNRYTLGFCLKFDWIDLPKEPGGWEAYYKAYNNGITNNSFRVKLSVLTDGKIVPKPAQQQEFSLFDTESNGTGILCNTTQLQDIDIKRLGLVKKPLLEKEDLLQEKNFAEGAIRLELTAPKDAFGHRLFPQIFPEIVLHNAKKSKKLPLPNQPYIPIIRSLSIDYTLKHSEGMSAANAKSNDGVDLKMFHIYPFGYEEIYPGKKRAPYNLIPNFDHENNLYIGLKDIMPKQELTLFFQMEENNFANLSKKTEPVYWSYMDDNAWVYFTEKDVLADSTNNFINSGIVKIKLPGDLATGNTRVTSDVYWIRASVKGSTNVQSKIIGIYTQAAMATRVVTRGTKNLNIPAGSIKSFKSKVIGIQDIVQLFPSFGGKAPETDEQFYTRVSERLRHNQKPLTNRDIEQAILERFPQILMAKCISPQQYSPEYVEKYRPNPRVVLIPREQTNSLFLSDEPKVNLSVRYQVKKFLEQAIPSFVKLDVENPVYEKIKVVCTVKFADDSLPDTGMYVRRLIDDIKRYLCPWLYDEGSKFKIGSDIYIGEMLNYIKKRPYIKYITGFSLVHFYTTIDDDGEVLARAVDYANNNEMYIRGSMPETVLIPNNTHLITVEDDMKYVKAKKVGISEFAVMDELLVNQDKQNTVIADEKLFEQDDKGKADFFDLVIPYNLD
ncbi:baseplate J/gp47 family protein [Mucilaginibacter sp. AW1-3]